MQETNTPQSVTVKVLAIIGFSATFLLVVFLLIEGITRAPGTFASLASIAKNRDAYKPITELTVELKKAVVNSEESFEIHWTDAKQKGTYTFGYTCTEGISLLVRAADGTLKTMNCTDALTLPHTVHGLFLSITSKENRFADVPLTVTFKNESGEVLYTGTGKMTVVNAQIPVGGNVAEETDAETPEEPKEEVVTPEPATPKPTTPVVPAQPKPVITTVYPESNPRGTTDLKVTMLGSGVIQRGIFTFTPTYDRDFENAIRFSIKNIGTKTSDTWSFTTTLPDGQEYNSQSQSPLKPQEYVEFTIGFGIHDNDDLVKVKTTVDINHDSNKNNNSASWSVVVQD